MGVAVGHLEIFDNFAFVPDMISSGHHIDAQIEKLLRQWRRDAKASGGIFAVGNDKIDGVALAQFGQAIFDDCPPRAPKNVTDKENFQNKVSGVGRPSMVSRENRGSSHAGVARIDSSS